MDEVNLHQAIQLSKDGRKLDARKLLRPLLEVDPESEKAWLWYANSFDSTDEKLKALQNCLVYCPNSRMAIEGIRVLKSQLQSPEVDTPEEPNNFAVNLQNSQGVKFAELDDAEKDTTSFLMEVNIPKEASPFFEIPKFPDSSNGSTTNEQPPINSGFQNGQTSSSISISAQSAGFSASPFYADEEISERNESTSILQTDQRKWTGNPFRIPFIISSGFGILLLLILCVIIIVLFFVK